jgi:ABC-type multidrug transport system ATPase subunit
MDVSRTPRPVIQVLGIRKTYGPTVAVDEVSFEVNEGEIFGLIGPNGAGKTTTMECIEGLRTRDRGTISVLGLDPSRTSRSSRGRICGLHGTLSEGVSLGVVQAATELWSASLALRSRSGSRRVTFLLNCFDEPRRRAAAGK